MNRLRNLVGLMAVCATAAFFTGCGGDNNNNSSGNNNTGNAPASLNGATYTLTDANGGGTLAFDQNGTAYTFTPGNTNNAAETGTFTATKNGEVWNVQTFDGAGGTNSAIALTFTGNGVGNYTIDRAGQQQVAGTFAAQQAPGTTTGNPGTTTGDPGTTTGNPGTVPAPATLQQITVTTAQSGIGSNSVYTVTFDGGASGNFTARNTEGNVTGTGTYSYTPQGNQAHLRMDYANLGGDYDDMTLVFTTAAGGGANQFSGTQQVGGTQYPFTGTFTY